MAEAPIVLDAHGRHAQGVRFTEDGSKLISVGQDARIRLWRVPDFAPDGVLEGHTKCVNTLSLHPDGDRIATSSTDNTTRIWSLGEARCLHAFEQQIHAVFSPDGKRLATIDRKNRVVIWNTETGAEQRAIAGLDQRLTSLAFTANGKTLLVGGTGAIHRIAVRSGEVEGTLLGHSIVVASLLLSPDGKLLASTGAEGTLRLWSTRDWSEVRKIQLRAGGIFQLAFSPDARRIVVSADHLIQVFEVLDGSLVNRIEVGLKGVYGVAVSPDGRWIASAAADGKVRIWDQTSVNKEIDDPA